MYNFQIQTQQRIIQNQSMKHARWCEHKIFVPLHFIDYILVFPLFFFLFTFLRTKKVRHVDHISEADADNDKCKLLNFQVPAIEFLGGGTHTADALKQAMVRCVCARLCSHFDL